MFTIVDTAFKPHIILNKYFVDEQVKVLYLERTIGDSNLAETILAEAGIVCAITIARDEQNFIDALNITKPDIILADDSIPGFTILNALAILRQQGNYIPLIALSGSQFNGNCTAIVRVIKRGAYDYIFEENIYNLPDAVINAIQKHNLEEKLAFSEIHEQALRLSEANLSAIIENTTDLVYSLDVDLKFITFNQLFKNTVKMVYGFDIEQGVGMMDQLIGYNTEMAEKWLKIYERALNGETQQFVNEYPFGEGKVYLSYSINPIWETGKVIGLSCFSRDITAQRLLELEREKITADLVQRNKALEQFTYIISHNLRAPVANIIGLSAIPALLKTDNEEIEEIINHISRSASKLDEVISDLNQVLQVNKTLTENIGPVFLPSLIEDIKLSISNLIEKERVNIDCDFGEHNEIISLKSFMYSVFYNLIQNSIKYRRPGVDPMINISTKIVNDKIYLIYNDNGRGMDTSKHGDDIFGLYKRFDTTVEGKGMGLFMVKMQVESLGGTVTVESVVNEGTIFVIAFPLTNMSKPEL